MHQFYTHYALDSIDSTNEEAKRLIRQGGAEDKLIISAKSQTNGHGRYGRAWESPSGNLYFSVLLKAEGGLQKSSQMSFVAAYALAELLAELLPQKACLNYKWPNDILVDAEKISGILLESLDGWIIIGIGVNIKNYPENVAMPATSLEKCRCSDIFAEDVLDKFTYVFEKAHYFWKSKGFSTIRDSLMNCAYRLDEEIKINLENKTLQGVFKGINESGELELATDDGVKLISSGEVFFS